jgi:hypothetical protein
VIAAVGWGLAMLAGTWVATRIGAGRHPVHGYVIGLILLAAAVVNMLMLPYPALFWGAQLSVVSRLHASGHQVGARQIISGAGGCGRAGCLLKIVGRARVPVLQGDSIAAHQFG